jgi:RNA polymerase sigma factor (sigma-70 family)
VDYQRHENNYTLIQDYAPQPSSNLEADLIMREECRTVEAAFNKLPREDREILALAVNGLPYRQIGEILGLSESNIKVRVHRARERLRDMRRNGEDK